jgi:hypothetical protein
VPVINDDMTQEQKELKQISFFCIAGLLLLVVVFFAPDTTNRPGLGFFKTAKMSTWHALFDWPAAWCSVKIILLSIGLFLVIDAIGSLLALIRFKSLALSVFLLHIVPAAGILFGSYYLLKALL